MTPLSDPSEWFFEYSLETPEAISDEVVDCVLAEAVEWARPRSLVVLGRVRAAPGAPDSRSWIVSFELSGVAAGRTIAYASTAGLTVHSRVWCQDRGWDLNGGPVEAPQDSSTSEGRGV